MSTKSILSVFGIFLLIFALSGCTSTTRQVTDSKNLDAGGEEYIVEITSEGFKPKTITINKGETVTFVNRDAIEHRPASDPHPHNDGYPGSSIQKCGTPQEPETFDACKDLTPGESYSFTFNETGTWGYHDYLRDGRKGTIVVK